MTTEFILNANCVRASHQYSESGRERTDDEIFSVRRHRLLRPISCKRAISTQSEVVSWGQASQVDPSAQRANHPRGQRRMVAEESTMRIRSIRSVLFAFVVLFMSSASWGQVFISVEFGPAALTHLPTEAPAAAGTGTSAADETKCE
jgi:hypothetical protein